MHFQNRQLARNFTGFKHENAAIEKEYELEIVSESQSSEDDVVNLE